MSNQVITTLTLEGSQYLKALRQAQAQAKGFATSTDNEMKRAGQSMAGLARSVIGVTAAVSGLRKVIQEGVSFNRFMQEQQTAFSVMMKSSDAAKAKIQELYDFAVNTPLTFKETTGAAKQLMAYGFEANELVGSLKMLGTVAKATGHPLNDIAYVYGTLRSQGRAYSRDLMQFGMRGIPIYEELSKVMGVGVEQLKKMTEEGKVGFREVEQAFANMTGAGGRFEGMLEKYMNTLSGKLSMLTDIFQQSAGKLTKGITDALTGSIGAVMDALTDSGGSFSSLGVMLGDMANALVNILATLIRLTPVIKVILGMLITAKVIQFFGSMPKLLIALGDAALVAAAKMGTLSVAMTGTAIAGAFADAAAGVGLFAKALLGLVANPAVAALAAIAASIGIIMSHVNKTRANDAAMMESDPAGLMRRNLARQQAAMGTRLQVTPEAIRDLAKMYSLSILDTIKHVEEMGMVSEAVAKQIRAEEASRAQRAGMATKAEMPLTAQELQRLFFSEITGNTPDTYKAASGLSLGQKAAQDYLKQFDNEMKRLKDIYGDLFTAEDVEGVLKGQMEQVWGMIEQGTERGTPMFVETLKEWYRRAMEQLSKDGAGGKPPKEEVRVFDEFYAREWRAKADAEDRNYAVAVEYMKANAELNKKFYEDKSLTEEDFYSASKSQLEWYYGELEKIEKERLSGVFGKMQSGDPEVFEASRQRAAQEFEAGKKFEGFLASLEAAMENTFVGKFISSTDKAATVLISLADAAADIADQFVSELLGKIQGINIGQSIDNMTTGIANFVNNLFGWGDAAKDSVEQLTKVMDDLKKQYDALKGRFDALIRRAEELVGNQIDSLQDLYEVGAITATQYQTDVSDMWETHADELKKAYELAGLAYPEDYATEGTLTEVYAALAAVAAELGVTQQAIDNQATAIASANTGTTAASDALTGAALGASIGSLLGPVGTIVGGVVGGLGGAIGDWLGWWDVGTPEITSDHLAMVHKGETIIPKTFAEGIRSGEMVLSGNGRGSGGGDVYVSVNVEGNVTAEKDLARSIAEEIYTQRRRGTLTV